MRVAVGGTPATVTAIPFATRKLSAAAEAPTSSDTVSGRLEDAKYVCVCVWGVRVCIYRD